MGKIITRYHEFNSVQKITYSVNEVNEILNTSMRKTYILLSSGAFPVLLVNRTKHIPIQTFHKWVNENMPDVILPCENESNYLLELETKKTLSVPEIRKLLNLKKTSAYEFIKSGIFETVLVNGFIRVKKDSFYKWFYSYRKDNVDGIDN